MFLNSMNSLFVLHLSMYFCQKMFKNLVYIVVWNFKMDHISCKQKSDSSVIFWMTGICQFFLNVFFMRPSKKTWRKFLLQLCTSYTNTISLFIQRLSEIFSALQKLKEMKHFDIWRRMKLVWSLRPQKNNIKTGFY
jgi:hypothetical protein